MPPNCNPKYFLNAWISSKRLGGRLNITTHDSFFNPYSSVVIRIFRILNPSTKNWMSGCQNQVNILNGTI